MDVKLTHSDIIEISYKWILKTQSCGIAFKELVSLSSSETPDVIGFGSCGFSVLIEAKVSRQDFLKDRKKYFRIYPENGMGTRRFYACPPNIIKKSDLPEGWGLIYVENNKIIEIYNPYKGPIETRHLGFKKNLQAEHGLMYSALRRLKQEGVIDKVYNYKNKNE